MNPLPPPTETVLPPKPTSAELAEQEASAELPALETLHEICLAEMNAQETPPIRLAEPGEPYNVTLSLRGTDTPEQTIADTETVREAFVRKATSAVPWWYSLPAVLEANGASAEDANTLEVSSKHTAEIVVDGKPQEGQFFEVFEVGETKADDQSLETVFETLQLLDQFSGGLLAADPKRPKLILSNDLRFGANNGGEEFKGVATDSYIVINMAGVAESAAKAGADPQEVLAVVIIHEMLGHGLDSLVAGRHGAYFNQHFHYSEERQPGAQFKSVHAHVEAKDEQAPHSHPVREYGGMNAAEDLATSVDASMSNVLGMNESLDKIPVMASKVDQHRSNLVMALMDEAAKQAAKFDNTPGVVGSEIRYVFDENGQVQGTEAARQLRTSVMSGEAAVQAEVAKFVNENKLPNELIVRVDRPAGV